jgi:hypothetical protein
MTITLPSFLEETKYLVGFEFPQADEDALRRCAQAWRTAASQLRGIETPGQALQSIVDAALGGDTGDAFDEAWKPIVRAGDGFIEQLAVICDHVAEACDHAATEVEYTKYEFIGTLILLAGFIAYLLGMLVFAGISAAGIPAAIATAQFSIRTLLIRLVTSVVLAEAFTVGFDALAQSIQIAQGHRDGWDGSKTVHAVEAGAIYGTANGVTFGLAGRFAPALLTSGFGRLGVASAGAFVGMETSGLANGDVPTGRNFLLSLTSSLVAGGFDALRPGGHAAPDVREPIALAGLDRFDLSNVDDLSRTSDVDSRGPDHLVGYADDAHLTGSAIDLHDPVQDRSVDHVDPGIHADDTSDTPASASGRWEGPPDRPATGAPVPWEGAPPSSPLPGGAAQTPAAVPTGGAVPVEVTTGTASGKLRMVAGDPLSTVDKPPVRLEPPAAGPGSDPAMGSPPAAPSIAATTPASTTPAGGTSNTTASATAVVQVAPAHIDRTSTLDRPVPPDQAIALAPRPELFPEIDDVEARNLIYDNLFATDAGLGFYVDGDGTRDFARAVEPTDGFVTIDIHGGTDGFYIDGHRITADQFARSLRDLYADGVLELPEGAGIKLLSCQTAFGGDDSPAAALSRALGVDVIAPDQVVWTAMDGVEIVSSPKPFGGFVIPTYPPDGAWHRFDPVLGEVPLDFDPGYHGPPVDGSRPLSQFDPTYYGGYDIDDPYDRDPFSGNVHEDYDDWSDRGRAGIAGPHSPGTETFPEK